MNYFFYRGIAPKCPAVITPLRVIIDGSNERLVFLKTVLTASRSQEKKLVFAFR
jgi:hypothetical protein